MEDRVSGDELSVSALPDRLPLHARSACFASVIRRVLSKSCSDWAYRGRNPAVTVIRSLPDPRHAKTQLSLAREINPPKFLGIDIYPSCHGFQLRRGFRIPSPLWFTLRPRLPHCI